MKIKSGFIKRKIQDKYLVVATGDASKSYNNFIELNATASFIWDYIASGYSLEQIAQKMVEEYQIDLQKAMIDAQKVIDILLKEGVICE